MDEKSCPSIHVRIYMDYSSLTWTNINFSCVVKPNNILDVFKSRLKVKRNIRTMKIEIKNRKVLHKSKRRWQMMI